MFIPRHPVVENQFCTYTTQSGITATGGTGNVLCYAGAVLYMQRAAANEEALVCRYDKFTNKPDNENEQTPIGFAMQKVKTGYHSVHPAGFMMPGDLGSSDVIAQPQYNSAGAITGVKPAPLGVAHNGIWDTVHYVCEHTDDVVADGNHMKPGQFLYTVCNNGARVTNCSDNASNDTKDYERIVTTVVARVLKGASAAKCSANIANTTLYPIRIKLLI